MSSPAKSLSPVELHHLRSSLLLFSITVRQRNVRQRHGGSEGGGGVLAVTVIAFVSLCFLLRHLNRRCLRHFSPLLSSSSLSSSTAAAVVVHVVVFASDVLVSRWRGEMLGFAKEAGEVLVSRRRPTRCWISREGRHRGASFMTKGDSGWAE
ncbi:hypothetical protein L484_026983 [Morus notabilis]|uniref:Uncharacterized protein n=1 Tax=Morus notabilis TaxID=981085 RepID=W9R1C5_9ROSA|nr:hypothetical protein L484_026983 [Morus notabilis]